MADIVKLDIMSDGSVSVDGTRITPNKMYGIQSVVKSVAVSKESIVKALDVEKEIRAMAIDEFAEKIRPIMSEFTRTKNHHAFIDVTRIAEQLKGGAE